MPSKVILTCGAKVEQVKMTFGVYRMSSGKISSTTMTGPGSDARLQIFDPVGPIELGI